MSLTPFGLDGPRAPGAASDLGIMAASGNLYCTGDPDRAPVRCREPAGYAHAAAETAFAALTALASGSRRNASTSPHRRWSRSRTWPRRPDSPSRGFRGTRRGANIGRTREIWPTRDGFVSFGLRGGKARVPSLETLTRLVDTDALRAMDWATFSPNTADDATLRAIEADVAAFFARHTMRELYAIACETNLMLAPINSPAEILAGEQLAARDFWSELPDAGRVPTAFLTVRGLDDARGTGSTRSPVATPGAGAWAGTNIVELGSGAAGPIATALLRGAGRHRPAHRVQEPARLPPCLRARTEEPARARGRTDVRRPQPGEA